MLAKQQSSKWKYLKFLTIVPLAAMLMMLFAFNLSGDLPDPIVDPLEKIEKEISDMAQRPVLPPAADELDTKMTAKEYVLKWGDIACACRNEQFPNYYHCENQSLRPKELKRLIRKEGGFEVFLEDERQAITDLKAVSKYMKDMGGYQGQFDEMDQSFNTESPLWKQAEKGDVFRFTFSNGTGDYFEFDVVMNNRREEFIFGSKVELGDYQFNINLTNDAGVVHMDVEDLQRLVRSPLRVQKNHDEYYQLGRATITNRQAIRQDEWTSIRGDALDVSQSNAIMEAFPGDRVFFKLESEDEEEIKFEVLLRKNSSWDGRKRDLGVHWGDHYFESQQIGILTKAELEKLKDKPMYLEANDRKYRMQDKKIEYDYLINGSGQPQQIPSTIRGAKAYIDNWLPKLKPGNMIRLSQVKSVDGYLTPNLGFFIDFDWKEAFPDNPNVKVLENNTLVIEPAQQEDLEKLLDLENFNKHLYKIQVDGKVFEKDYKYFIENKIDGKSVVLEHTPEKSVVEKRIVVSRVDCLNCE